VTSNEVGVKAVEDRFATVGPVSTEPLIDANDAKLEASGPKAPVVVKGADPGFE
jgi:hypothetical protein